MQSPRRVVTRAGLALDLIVVLVEHAHAARAGGVAESLEPALGADRQPLFLGDLLTFPAPGISDGVVARCEGQIRIDARAGWPATRWRSYRQFARVIGAVCRGESVTLLDRDQPIAVITPLRASGSIVDRLVVEGVIIPADEPGVSPAGRSFPCGLVQAC